LAHESRKGEIAWLIDLLGVSLNKLVSPESIDERLKVQKAVFLLKHLGFPPFKDYEFGTYLRGPYSPTLAEDYYKLRDVKPIPIDLGEKKDLLAWFIAHTTEWLEVSASIISIMDRYPKISDEEIYKMLLISKPWVKEEEFRNIIKDLKSKGLR